MRLGTFLVSAKKNTYASGKKPEILKDGFEEFFYEESDYKYRDRYYVQGSNSFGGEEVVWYKGKIIWMMNYYGYMISDKIDSKIVYEFLRKAMRLVNEQKPFRGPSNLKDGEFEYWNNFIGDVNQFKGAEKILFMGKEVYKLDYHGGAI